MKKHILALCTLSLAAVLTACGTKDDSSSHKDDDKSSSSSTSVTDVDTTSHTSKSSTT